MKQTKMTAWVGLFCLQPREVVFLVFRAKSNNHIVYVCMVTILFLDFMPIKLFDLIYKCFLLSVGFVFLRQMQTRWPHDLSPILDIFRAENYAEHKRIIWGKNPSSLTKSFLKFNPDYTVQSHVHNKVQLSGSKAIRKPAFASAMSSTIHFAKIVFVDYHDLDNTHK